MYSYYIIFMTIMFSEFYIIYYHYIRNYYYFYGLIISFIVFSKHLELNGFYAIQNKLFIYLKVCMVCLSDHSVLAGKLNLFVKDLISDSNGLMWN